MLFIFKCQADHQQHGALHTLRFSVIYFKQDLCFPLLSVCCHQNYSSVCVAIEKSLDISCLQYLTER